MMKPMLAATLNPALCSDLRFPLLATPKVDGVRALIIGGVLVSRSLRPIPNCRIRMVLEGMLPEGADGEIFCGDLYTTTSTVMSHDADGSFRFFWFDWVNDASAPYDKRLSSIRGYIAVHDVYSEHVLPLMPETIRNTQELYNYEEQVLDQGFEGVVLRVPDGRYKYGRSTLKEGLMVKLKRYADSEATIVGTEELVHRDGGKGGTLGSIVVATPDGIEFKIGTGYTADQRLALWHNRSLIVGKTIRYKHDSFSDKKARPRSPVFIEIRHEDDTSK